MPDKKGLSPVAAAILFTLLVPTPMGVGIPYLISRWQFQTPYLGIEAGRWIGGAMIVVGSALMLSAIAWFAKEGVKPYPPIERVITTGPYAYTRNPMYGGVVMLIIGQGLLFGSRGVGIYGLCWLAAFYIFELTIDDPFIVKRIGAPYEDYMKSVPGWLPTRFPRRQVAPGSRSDSQEEVPRLPLP